MTKKTYTLFELNTHLRRAIALNFQEPVWIACELAQVDYSRGHFYLQLVQKEEDSDQLAAQSSGVIWNKQYLEIRKSCGTVLDTLLQPGNEVLIAAKVDYNERYGLKLIIREVDPGYTLGKIHLRKRQVLEQIQQEGLLEKNKQHPLPLVFQNIAIISAPTAAGYLDFINQLNHNPYKYQFNQELFPSAMQGTQVEAEITKQFKRINAHSNPFDAVVIIRGGGSKTDLSAFDQFQVAKAIARSKYPVFTGIGHEIDETIADKVAAAAFKTPTAVAEYLIHHNLNFEGLLLDKAQSIYHHIKTKILESNYRLDFIQNQLKQAAVNTIQNQYVYLKGLEQELPRTLKNKLQQSYNQIDIIEKMVDSYNIERVLDKGFTLTLKGNIPIKSAQEIQKGDKIMTLFRDGNITSISS